MNCLLIGFCITEGVYPCQALCYDARMDDDHGQGIAEHDDKMEWLPSFVYGGIDGAVTTFAVVAGVEGASLSVPIILILGFANLFADGFSMAVGKYFSDKADLDRYKRIEQIEYLHLNTKTEHEREEVREIMEKYGFKGKDLDKAVEVITSNPKAWVDLMMRNEFHLTNENVRPVKGAVVTFVSFLLIGFIPLMGYVFKGFLPFSENGVFILTCAFTLLALFIVGTVKAKFSTRHWFISGLETMAIGGFAAGIAYAIGYALQSLV